MGVTIFLAMAVPLPGTAIAASVFFTMSTRTSTPALVSGCATADGTIRYRARFPALVTTDFYRALPAGRLASSLGLGTYLGECDDAEDLRYAGTTRLALESGVNVIDTAINYRCQRSERAVAEGLRAALALGTVARDEVLLCTKGGYIPLDGAPPASREVYARYLADEYFDRGLMTPDDVVAGGHCLAPRFLADQIGRSRRNLGVETIDLYYLHNPEQQLDTLSRDRFRGVIRDAFVLLEDRVHRGEINGYGCATWNGFRVPPAARAHLSLRELVELARDAGGADHHFQAVQLPVNLALNEAVRLPTQPATSGRLVPLLEAALELGIAVVASATLMQAQLARGLPPQLAEAFPGLTSDAQRAIAFVRSLPGITTALVGMKQPAHLEENLGAA